MSPAASESRHSRVGVALACLVLAPSYARAETKGQERPGYLSVSVGLGVGSAAMDSFHRGVDTYVERISNQSPSLVVKKTPKSGLVKSFDLRLRYFPGGQIFVESGFSFLSNGSSTGIVAEDISGTLSYKNSVFEVPVLVGAFYRFDKEFLAYASLGPTLFFANKSTWSLDIGRISSFRAGRGGGVVANVGMDWLAIKRLLIGVRLAYRYGKTKNLSVTGVSYPPLQPLEEIDFSGLSVAFSVGVIVF